MTHRLRSISYRNHNKDTVRLSGVPYKDYTEHLIERKFLWLFWIPIFRGTKEECLNKLHYYNERYTIRS